MYGHVWLEIGPSEPGAGYVFENDIVGGVIPKEFIALDRKGRARGAWAAASWPAIRSST